MTKTVRRVANLSNSSFKGENHRYRIKKMIRKCRNEEEPASGNFQGKPGVVWVRKNNEDEPREARILPDGSNTLSTLETMEDLLQGKDSLTGSKHYLDVTYLDTGEKDVISLPQLVKTEEEWGGGGGRAGGSLQTETVEAAQCVYCSFVQVGDSSRAILKKGLEPEQVIANLGDSNLTTDPTRWKNTTSNIAKALVKDLSQKGFTDGYWHYKDSFMESVGEVYSSCKDKLKGKLDRYNPADIWWTKENYTSLRDPRLTESTEVISLPEGKVCLEDLTKTLLSLYNLKLAVGISLKEVSTSKVKVEAYDDTKRREPLDIHVKDREKIERGKGYLTLTIPFVCKGKEGKCQLRKCNTCNIRGSFQYKGNSYFDGSIAQEIIVECLGMLTPNPEEVMPSFFYRKKRELQERYILNNPFLFEEEDIKDAEEFMGDNYPLEPVEEPESFSDNEEEFEKEEPKKEEPKRKSSRERKEERILNHISAEDSAVAESLDRIAALLRDSKKSSEEIDLFLESLARYAWSLHEKSCTFLKVENEN